MLQVGEKMVSKGMSEARWQAMLDDAGYPRTPPLRRMAPGSGTESPPVTKAAANTPPATPGPAPVPSPLPDATAAAPAGGYPK